MSEETKEWRIISRANCPWCVKAISLLETLEQDVLVEPYHTDENVKFLKDNGLKTVPQVFHKGKHIGGYEDLSEYIRTNSL